MTTAQIDHALDAQAASARAWQELCDARLRRYDPKTIALKAKAYEVCHGIERAALFALSPKAA